MDVTCERCGTEYEFDETLVSDRGTTVKCTNCGHLFKVFRPEASGAAKSWHVEQADGTTRTLGTLKELQRLIADGVLSPHDRISRGNEPKKRLGEIAELATFFEAAATVVGDAPPRPRRSTSPGRGPDSTSEERPLARTLDGAAVPPMPAPGDTVPPRRPKGTMMGIGAQQSEPPPRQEPSVPRAAPPPRPAPSRPPPPPRPPRPVERTPLPAGDADVTAPHRPVRVAPVDPPQAPRESASPSIPPYSSEAPRSTPPESGTGRARGLYLDAQEPAAPPRAKSRSGLWVTLVVLLAAGVGVALGWPQIAPLLGLSQPADPALPHLDAGDAALARDHVPGYESAVTHYTQALAHDDHDHRVLTRLSRAQALWAQALLFDAQDREARAGEDPALGGEAAAIRREVQRHAETALARGEDAVRHGAGDVEAEVALADALRLTGDLTRARSRLDRALSLRREASAETLRVQALIEAAEGGGDLAPAQPRAEEAVAEDPGMIRARLLYARALLAGRDVGGARQQIDAILRRDAQHPLALALRSAIDEGRPPAPPTVDVPDGGASADAGVAPAPAEPEPPPVAASAPAPSRGGRDDPAPSSGAIPAGRDYSWYVRNGDEQRQRGDLARARAFYEAARQVRPGGSEALTGLGYAELSGGNSQTAASLFRQAAGQGYAEAYIGLGDAYRRLNRHQDALTAYERYLERLPGGPHAAQAQQSAAQLRQQLGAQGGSEPAPTPAPAPTEPPATEPAPAEPAPSEPAPSTPPEALPPPRDMETPPPRDVPAVESDPEYQP